MKVQNNYSQKTITPSFGMIELDDEVRETFPEFAKLVDDNAGIVDKLTPNNDVFCFWDSPKDHVYLIKTSKKGKIRQTIEILYLMFKAFCSDKIGTTMPQQAESLRLPVTKNGLINALKKITGIK